MIADLRPYMEYKESGLPWLEQVPGHWGALSVKQVFEIQLGKMLQNAPRTLDDSSVPYLKSQHVQWSGVRTTDLPQMWASPREIMRFGVRSGDLLVCEGGEGGRCAVLKSIPTGVIIQNALHRVRSRLNGDTRFLSHVMSVVASVGWFEAINNKATIAHFTIDKFGALGIPLPPPSEQAAIGRFLDRAIRAKRKVIALLNEQKQAIIHRAVTRGLDASVPLKPSGIPWLGDIPQHWEVKRAKYLYREVDERSSDGSEELLSVSHITGVTPRSQKNITMFKAASYSGHKLCQPGDLVINTMWAWMGALGVSTHAGIVSPAYAVYRPHHPENIVGIYMDGLLRSKPYVSNIICHSTGLRASRLRLYPEEFFRLPIIQPPTEEQQRIVESIQGESSELDTTIARLEREIELLREYRTRLVADVVTGKLDVREAAARLPEETPPGTAENGMDMEDDETELDPSVSEEAP